MTPPATPALAPYERIKRVALLEREFEIEKDEITPSLKVKRNIIEDRYRDVIDALYREDGGL
jgi:long-chain acyl-CoA synthetase